MGGFYYLFRHTIRENRKKLVDDDGKADNGVQGTLKLDTAGDAGKQVSARTENIF